MFDKNELEVIDSALSAFMYSLKCRVADYKKSHPCLSLEMEEMLETASKARQKARNYSAAALVKNLSIESN